ncbi:MAG: lipoate--protein ligase family protein [Arthrospira sp. PLM2.Bin9]|nr:biotin/lipoate A/B protein ligase family protein [Arthrospira sp. PLM2.Bin9]TVU54562.1 MAG: lipoate--protein ligase family protein [Arthrospira sp. PLM2.Bin9]
MSTDNSVWRLIPLTEASGRLQMAIDSWLLSQHEQGCHPSTLRFYTWQPVAISLGYHQRRWPEFWQNLQWQNQPIELVRRPSGGRGVLHQGDLTYAVVTSGLSGSRSQIYRHISEFLITGWRSLGFNLDYGSAGRGYIHHPNCFGTATGADLVLETGYKLIGSAQLCRGRAVLQHGSMRLTPDAGLQSHVFGTAMASPPLLSMELQTVIDALIMAATDRFGIQLDTQPLTEAEWEQIAKFVPQFSV